MSTAALLALADSRLPAGGHAHSAGTEQAVVDGYVTDEASLGTLLRRRLLTAGVVAAHLAAAACAAALPPAGPDDHAADHDPSGKDHGLLHDHGREGLRERLAALDAEADARLPAPAARSASRAQGRGLVRVAALAWPSAAWAALPRTPHHPLAVGVAAAAGGSGPRDAALVALYLTATAPASAAARLLGLDPATVAVVLASLGPLQDDLAGAAAAAAASGQEVPCESDPLADLLVTRHAPRTDKLFAS